MAATRVAIITGSSQGIGAAVADRLARDGLAVAINYAGNEAPARALADKITDRGGHAIAVQANVNGPEALTDNVAALGMILSAEHAAALDAVSGGNENLLYGLSRPPLRNQVVFGGAEV